MSVLTRASLVEYNLLPIGKGADISKVIVDAYAKSGREAVCVLNVSEIERHYNIWKTHLPEVQVRYAVKCNMHPLLLRSLHLLGAGFDCASPAEVRAALSAGCPPSKIIYANPQKPKRSIEEAFRLNCNTFTFDSEHELLSMLESTPPGKVGRFVLRLLPPDESSSICRFGVKFGASPSECYRLIRLCKHLGADLVGFSFHVGSGCGSVDSFRLAVQYMGEAAKFAKEQGFTLTVLNIGGGYMSKGAERHYDEPNRHAHITPPSFEEIASALREEINRIKVYFTNKSEDLEIMAEPGRFFAGDIMTLGTRIYGRRIIFDKIEDNSCLTEKEIMESGKASINEVKYYVGDGVYGYYNAILFDHVVPHLRFTDKHGNRKELSGAHAGSSLNTSSIFGPTCDSLDCILKERKLPLLDVGDWVITDAFGAYTYAAATEFNGIPHVSVVCCIEE